ncbi:hypothetical protein BC835DRAFT_1415954 [Cytidiella melzeri]|nr:hypothetical protein BC835DRAFT_1415954 [Cytidiella melzeri]
MVLNTPISTSALDLFNNEWHYRRAIYAEAGSSKMQLGVSELTSDIMDDGDTDPDSCMTDTTLVEDTSDEYDDDSDFAPTRKEKLRAVCSPITPFYHEVLSTWEIRRGSPDIYGIREVTFPKLARAKEKSASFEAFPTPRIPDMKVKEDTLPSLIRPRPNYVLPSLVYTIECPEKREKPEEAVIKAVEFRRKACFDAHKDLADADQKLASLRGSCLTCRKEGLSCNAKRMRQRHVSCAACVKTGCICRWAAEEGTCGQKRTVPFDISEDEEDFETEAEDAYRPLKKPRLSESSPTPAKGKTSRRRKRTSQ